MESDRPHAVLNEHHKKIVRLLTLIICKVGKRKMRLSAADGRGKHEWKIRCTVGVFVSQRCGLWVIPSFPQKARKGWGSPLWWWDGRGKTWVGQPPILICGGSYFAPRANPHRNFNPGSQKRDPGHPAVGSQLPQVVMVPVGTLLFLNRLDIVAPGLGYWDPGYLPFGRILYRACGAGCG